MRADNGKARVRRSYKPNGLLAHDTLTLRTYYSTGVSPCEVEPGGNGPTPSQEWTTHVYALQNSYDLDGRRTQIASPASTISYSYDADGRGLLTGVSETGYTSTSLNYDAAGRIRSLNHPGSVTDTRTYGTSGLLTDRVVGSVIDDDLSYDYRGLITSAYNTYRRGQTAQVTATTAYNGLGAVVSATNHTTTSGAAENFRVDAIGNRLRVGRPGLKPSTHPDFWGIRFQSYDEHARLVGVVDTTIAGTDDFVLSETYQFDGSGAMSLQYSSEWQSGQLTLYDQTRSYFGIDDRLAVVNRHVGVSSASQSLAGRVGVYQENWYDALGRRVLVRARKPASCSSTTLGELACRSFIERTVWDGDQVLLERRADGASGLTSSQLDQQTSSGEAYGEVVSIHATGSTRLCAKGSVSDIAP